MEVGVNMRTSNTIRRISSQTVAKGVVHLLAQF